MSHLDVGSWQLAVESFPFNPLLAYSHSIVAGGLLEMS